MWDARYSREDYLFGEEPARFLVGCERYLKPGSEALLVADGEGRNSVYVASKGPRVRAFDASPVAVEKARRLAAARGVAVDYAVADLDGWDWRPGAYDLVVAIFIQFLGPGDMVRAFARMTDTLRPGGRILLHGYRPEQLAYKTGGPPVAENMYTEESLRRAFADLEIERLESYDAELREGTGHVGMSALIDLVARKP